MSIRLEDVIRFLEGLSSEELGKLTDEIVARFGLPPRVAPAAPEPTHPPVESTMGIGGFDLVLEDSGPDKVAVIVLIRKLFALGLRDAKDAVERTPPVTLRCDVEPREAKGMVAEFARAGARVTLR